VRDATKQNGQRYLYRIIEPFLGSVTSHLHIDHKLHLWLLSLTTSWFFVNHNPERIKHK